MKKPLKSALALVALIGLCNVAKAELVCDDGGPGAKASTRTGCVASAPSKVSVSPSATRPPVTPRAVSSPPAAAVHTASVPPATTGSRVQPGIGVLPNPAAAAITHWEIKASDMSIYGAIKRWGDANAWQVSWELGDDYPVTVLASFDDNFRGAVDAVLNAYRDADVAPKGCFYENKVLRIVRRVGDERECDAKAK
jgi:hypothetical protein